MADGGRVLTGPLPDLRQAISRLGGEEDPGWWRAAGGGARGGVCGYLKLSPALVTEDRAAIRIFINHTITPSGRSAPHRETMLQLWLHIDCITIFILGKQQQQSAVTPRSAARPVLSSSGSHTNNTVRVI